MECCGEDPFERPLACHLAVAGVGKDPVGLAPGFMPTLCLVPGALSEDLGKGEMGVRAGRRERTSVGDGEGHFRGARGDSGRCPHTVGIMGLAIRGAGWDPKGHSGRDSGDCPQHVMEGEAPSRPWTCLEAADVETAEGRGPLQFQGWDREQG